VGGWSRDGGREKEKVKSSAIWNRLPFQVKNAHVFKNTNMHTNMSKFKKKLKKINNKKHDCHYHSSIAA
jgi:hypothetical protein